VDEGGFAPDRGLDGTRSATELSLLIGTHVVARVELAATQGTPFRPQGSVGVLAKMPADIPPYAPDDLLAARPRA